MESRLMPHLIIKRNFMQPIQSISIPQPCHENWNQMTPVEQGRHCNVCRKTVTDFTVMSNNEIINYFTEHTNTCGRFDSHQLASVNNHLELQDKPKFSWKRAALAAAITSLFATTEASAQETVGEIAVSQSFNTVKKMSTGDTVKYNTIKGKVLDDSKLPVPGAQIKIPGTALGAFTDVNGNFQLKTPSNIQIFTVCYIGMQTEKIAIDSNLTGAYNIGMKALSGQLGGAVAVVRVNKVPFYKMWWYKLKRAF
ncbi:hypothetical protein ABIB39_002081 [Mucilaginibacter sp. UYP27]